MGRKVLEVLVLGLKLVQHSYLRKYQMSPERVALAV